MSEAKNDKKQQKKAMQSKTLDTYLKSQNRLLMSSISIADKKASILVRLNTTLVSSLIVFESYFDTISTVNLYIIPVLIIGLSFSLLFAILVAKPFSATLYKILKQIKTKYPKIRRKQLFLN